MSTLYFYKLKQYNVLFELQGGCYLLVYFYMMDVEQDVIVAEQEQNQNQLAQLQSQQKQITQNTKSKLDKNYILPKQFSKAKRTATKLVNEYFTILKKQLLAHPNAKFLYANQHITTIENALAQLATIRYTDLSLLVPKKPDIVQDFLLSYVAESKKIIKYNMNIHNNNNHKPKQVILQIQQGIELPDNATPAAFGANAYFFDGSKFDFSRMAYVPIQQNHKINLITGQVSLLESQPPFYRMKCCILKVKRGFFIVGGYVGVSKNISRKCNFYSVQNCNFSELCSLNYFHSCPSGCVHNDKVYIFSSAGIQYYDQKQNTWNIIQMPRRLKILPFQYCMSVSATQIMIIGGKSCNHNSTDIKIYNTQQKIVDEYPGMLPVGISNQRSWGPMIINNYIAAMSNIQASIFPQVMIKKDAVQLVLVGFGGCFLNTLICS